MLHQEKHAEDNIISCLTENEFIQNGYLAHLALGRDFPIESPVGAVGLSVATVSFPEGGFEGCRELYNKNSPKNSCD